MIARRYGALAAVVFVLTVLSACAPQPPRETKESAVQAGDALAGAGKFEAAVSAYRRAVALDPRDGRLRLKLARAHEQAQQWAEAGREAMRSADLLPGDYEAGVLAARLVLAQSRFDDSLTITTALLRNRPDDVDLLLLWSTATARLAGPYFALFRLGPTGGRGDAYDRACTSLRPPVASANDREAEAVLRRVLALAPGHFQARFALVGLLWATRRADESEALLQALADEFPTNTMANEAAGHFFFARHRPDLGERYLRSAASGTAAEARAPRLALADIYLANGRPLDALTLLDGVGGPDDDGGVIAVRRALATLNLGRHADALAQLNALIARYPAHAQALALQSQALLDTHDTNGAVAAGRSAVTADPDRFDAHLALGRALEALEDLDGAFREYGEALRQDPSAVRLAVKLAQLGLLTDRPRAALVYARQAVGQFPDDRGARLTMVDALTRAGDYKAADFWLAPVLRAPDVPADAHILRAALAAGAGDDAAARAALADALRLAPGSVKALAALVALDLDRRRVVEARVRVDEALDGRPDDPDVLRLAGHVRLAEGDLTGAEAVLRRARVRRPADTDVALLLAQTLADLHRPAEARDLLEEVLRRRPSSLVGQTALAGLLEGMGQSHDAEAIYLRVLGEYPDAVQPAARLAVQLVTVGRHPSIALNLLAVARRTAPDDAAVNDALGWVELHLDRASEAVRHLEIATRRDPANATYHYHLGAAYVREGRVALARETLERALALDPALPDRRRVEGELARLR